MDINSLIKKQASVTNDIQKMYLSIVSNAIKKYGIEKSRDIIMDELRKQIPQYIRDALSLGVGWINKGEK